jgi:predicted nucleic acid-binding protein
MKATVLDASAVLTLLFDEAGADKVEQLFHAASEAEKQLLVSAVNWAEVLYRIERKHGRAGLETARLFGRTMPIEIVPVDRELAEAAASLKVKHTLGLADAFAVALAIQKKAVLVATDREFVAVEKEIKMEWLK